MSALRALVPPFAVLAMVAIARPASANELADFERARDAYRAQDYELAAALFGELVGQEVPRLRSRALLLESRKFLAASYLFLGRQKEAEAEFERLLRDEWTYELDPLAFPDEVQKTFVRVRRRLQQRRRDAEEASQRAEEEARRKEVERVLRERESLHRLAGLAETERVERVNTRWIAAIPFGVGQFQNGHTGSGVFLAVSEGVLAAVNITTYFLHQDLEGLVPVEEELGAATFAEKAFRHANQISLGLLVAMVVAGIVDAQIRFRPSIEWSRRRELPQELRDALRVDARDSTPGLRMRF